MIRLAVVAVVLAVVVASALVHRRRSAVDAARGGEGLPELPGELVADAPATWVIFTTPFCASCGAVQSQLEQAFPHHRVVKVDASDQVELAERYDVRRAPTTLLADRAGTVLERLVGPEAVREFIGTTDDPALLDV